MASDILHPTDSTFQDEPLRFEIGDIIAVSDDAYGEVRLSWTVGDRTGDHYFKPGMRGVVTLVQRERSVYDDLIYVTFDDGTTDNMFAGWLELIHRPVNDPAMYECDLFELAERQQPTDASQQEGGAE